MKNNNSLNLIKHLIEIPSISGNEKEISKYIFSYLEKLNLNPIYVGPNVTCKISGMDTSRALIFNGHIDTVPPGDINMWKNNPFVADVTEDKVTGLGASDMKAGITAMMLLAEYLSKNQPKIDVWFQFVVNEETDGSGTEEIMRWFVKNQQKKYQKINAIIPESTSLEKIEVAHKGNIFLKVTIKGDSGHGSEPEKIKKPAINEMYIFAEKLAKIVAEWGNEYKDSILGKPSIAFTSIQGGNVASPNKIADSCIGVFDIRTTPKVHDKALSLLKKELSNDNIKIETVFPPLSYGYTDPNTDFVKTVQEVAKVPVSASKGSTDQLFFTHATIEAIIFGPGIIGCAHTVNEYCDVSYINKCVEIFKIILDQL